MNHEVASPFDFGVNLMPEIGQRIAYVMVAARHNDLVATLVSKTFTSNSK